MQKFPARMQRFAAPPAAIAAPDMNVAVTSAAEQQSAMRYVIHAAVARRIPQPMSQTPISARRKKRLGARSDGLGNFVLFSIC
jgi:hypothetical protein